MGPATWGRCGLTDTWVAGGDATSQIAVTGGLARHRRADGRVKAWLAGSRAGPRPPPLTQPASRDTIDGSDNIGGPPRPDQEEARSTMKWHLHTRRRRRAVQPVQQRPSASRPIRAPSTVTPVSGGSRVELSSKSPAPRTARRPGTATRYARASAPNATGSQWQRCTCRERHDRTLRCRDDHASVACSTLRAHLFVPSGSNANKRGFSP